MLTAIDHVSPRPVLRLVTHDDPLASLTAREREVLSLLAEGLSNRAIRERLFIAPKTLERHIRHVFAKLDLSDDRGRCNPRVLAALLWHEAAGGREPASRPEPALVAQR